MGLARIAVIEDEDDVRDLVREVLEGRGYEVHPFPTLGSAIEGLRDSPPDLVITDVGLPDGCGLELVATLKDLVGRRVPTIVLSGLNAERDFARGFAAGAVDYMPKPFSPTELLARCAIHLARADAKGGTTSLDLDLPQKDGLTFGRYVIERELGRGGFGRVYLARDQARRGAQVAVKVLAAFGHDQQEARLRFVRETYTLASIKHPGVASIYDIGSGQGQLYYAMEYVPGPPLFARVRKQGTLSESEAIELARGLLGALAALGRAGLVHRDLKPNNVILRDGDIACPVLIDFGLAKRPCDRGITPTDQLMGTPGYFPPEILAGKEADHRSDLFALGLTLRFALDGEHLYPELEGFELVRTMADAPIPPPATPVSAPFGAFLASLVQGNPRARPANAVAALTMLEAIQPEPPTARVSRGRPTAGPPRPTAP